MSHRTLVVHTGGVGDFICALPALKSLGQATTLEIAGIPERAALAQHAGIASAVYNLDQTDFHTVFASPSERLRQFCQGYDAAIVWMDDRDQAIQRGLQHAGIPSVLCHRGIPPAHWNLHASEWYARCLGVTIELPFLLHQAPRSPAGPVVLHPGSGDPGKNWPLASYMAMADALSEAGHTVHWCAGPAETDIRIPGHVLSPMPLTELAHVLSQSRLFLGNDSGISHLAAVTGCITLSIFGPTDPCVWRPIGPRVHVLAGEPWPSVAEVRAAVRHALQ